MSTDRSILTPGGIQATEASRPDSLAALADEHLRLREQAGEMAAELEVQRDRATLGGVLADQVCDAAARYATAVKAAGEVNR